ncbi:MAG: hypothetical protein WC900_07595 [Oscillospiraceae bacterium]|jgi:hypothetical protein
MNNQEALDFAKERLSRISYLLEKADTPCESFYEKQEEMLIQAVLAMEEQAERKRGCKMCNSDVPMLFDTFTGMDGNPVNFCPNCGRDLRKLGKNND